MLLQMSVLAQALATASVVSHVIGLAPMMTSPGGQCYCLCAGWRRLILYGVAHRPARLSDFGKSYDDAVPDPVPPDRFEGWQCAL
ncbi:MAG: hypothetical protein GDA36_07175 [Rhodobacteraceae bacterium]|nr:hypothetical protein [Paracoccaceae bacterium]